MSTTSFAPRTAIATAALLALVSLSPFAAAQDPRAEALFREGRDAMTRGDVEVACAKFEESLSLEQSIGPLLNLAECNEKRGQLVRALQLWREGLAKLPESDGRRDLASRRVADLERRVPTVVLDGAGPGVRLFVDGRPAPPGEPVPVDPGTHRITVTGADGASRTFPVEVAEGRATPVDVSGSDPAGTSGPAPSAPPDAVEGPSYVPAIVAFSIGGAGLAAFGITGAMWLGEKSTVDEECPGRVCSDAGLAAGDSGQTLGIVNAIALGVGVAGVGVGGFLLWRASDDEPSASASVSFTGSEVVLDGRF